MKVSVPLLVILGVKLAKTNSNAESIKGGIIVKKRSSTLVHNFTMPTISCGARCLHENNAETREECMI